MQSTGTRAKTDCEDSAAEQGPWLAVATTDADQAASIQREWTSIQYDQVDSGRFEGEFRKLTLPSTLIATERQNRTVLKQQYFPAQYCSVSLIREISRPGRCELSPLSARRIGYMPGDRGYDILMPPSEILFFRFDQDRLLQAADTLGYKLHANGRRMLFIDGLDTNGLDDIADTLFALQHGEQSKHFAALNHDYLDQTVLVRTLGILLGPQSPVADLPSVAGAYRITAAAREFIERDEEVPTSVIMLCEALGMSRATLQRAFLQMYGVSPLTYLRLRRLNGVRRALRAARGTEATAATVSSIAMHWGFFHLSRFAQDYNQHFGELPSTTLGGRPR